MKCCLSFFCIFIAFINNLYSVDVKDSIDEVSYIFCIDGGGTHTRLQILDSEGNLQKVVKGQQMTDFIDVSSSNISNVGPQGVGIAFDELFIGLKVGLDKIPFKSIVKQSAVVGGFAGSGQPKERKVFMDELISWGFKKDKIALYTDAHLALELIDESGACLISGMGSICLYKENGIVHQSGGFGRLLGDEGSGYHIAVQGLKSALEDEYGYGNKTILTKIIKDYFNVSEVKELVSRVYSGHLPPDNLAKITPFIFEAAWNKDQEATKIIDKAAEHLSDILGHSLKKNTTEAPVVYLIGGIFRNRKSKDFIKKMINSSSIQSIPVEKRPIFINMGNENIPYLVVLESLFSKNKSNSLGLVPVPLKKQQLPKLNPFYSYNTQNSMTEYQNVKTVNLSEEFKESIKQGVETLLEVDKEPVKDVKLFIKSYLKSLTQVFSEKIANGGRLIFIGAGSSGRLAIDLAAKWKGYWKNTKYKNSVQGAIAGGAQAFIRSVEKAEDSIDYGFKSIEKLELQEGDILLLISNSGTSKFNVGAAQSAQLLNIPVYYLYSSHSVPSYTQELFDEALAQPILIETGPQSIPGSTRLQGATLIELSLGIALDQVSARLENNFNDVSQIVEGLNVANKKLLDISESIASIIELEKTILSIPDSTFRQVKDHSDKGYISFIGDKEAIREIITDTTEMSPTFSTNPIRSINEKELKQAEFRAYLTNEEDNLKAWELLLGKTLTIEEVNNLYDLLLSIDAPGWGSFVERPTGEGNLLIGVIKNREINESVPYIKKALEDAQKEGAKTALIVVGTGEVEESIKRLASSCDVQIILEGLASDRLGLVETLTLKQLLNVISNGSMISLNKVYGNRMVDLFPSNNKLVDRSIRMIREIHKELHPNIEPPSYELLFKKIVTLQVYRKRLEEQHKRYIPSPIKITLTMLECGVNFSSALKILRNNDEDINKIVNLPKV